MSTPYESAPVGPAGSEPPPSNLVWAILTTIFCCLPFGIASIVFASQVNGKWAAGDYAGAQESSRKARRWAIISAIVGLVLGVIVAIFYGAIFAAILNDPEFQNSL